MKSFDRAGETQISEGSGLAQGGWGEGGRRVRRNEGGRERGGAH